MSDRLWLSTLILLTLTLALAGCSTPRPVLYPNAHLQEVGEAASQEDIDSCIGLANAADLEKNRTAETAKSTGVGAGIGAVVGVAVGAITGSPGTGAAAGAAGGGIMGFFRGLFGSAEPHPAFKGYVDACLREKGYQPVGWK